MPAGRKILPADRRRKGAAAIGVVEDFRSGRYRAAGLGVSPWGSGRIRRSRHNRTGRSVDRRPRGAPQRRAAHDRCGPVLEFGRHPGAQRRHHRRLGDRPLAFAVHGPVPARGARLVAPRLAVGEDRRGRTAGAARRRPARLPVLLLHPLADPQHRGEHLRAHEHGAVLRRVARLAPSRRARAGAHLVGHRRSAGRDHADVHGRARCRAQRSATCSHSACRSDSP